MFIKLYKQSVSFDYFFCIPMSVSCIFRILIRAKKTRKKNGQMLLLKRSNGQNE